MLAVLEHPPVVPVTEYVVVDIGVTVREAEVPRLLFHKKSVAPVAVRVTEVPAQMVFVGVEMLTIGLGLTNTVTLAESNPPQELPITVYVAVAAGVKGTP
jgi:hypothetical protein